MASFHRLPERYERVILVGGVSRFGAVCAASLALSPFLHPHQQIVLANAITTADANDGAVTATVLSTHETALAHEAAVALQSMREAVPLGRTEVGSDGIHPATAQSHLLPIQCFLGGQHPVTAAETSALLQRIVLHTGESSKDHTAGGETNPTQPTRYSAGPLVVRREKDVLLCVLSADAQQAEPHAMRHDSVVRHIQHVLAAGAGGGGLQSSGGCVLAVTDDRSRYELTPLLLTISGTGIASTNTDSGLNVNPCVLVVARARELTPPALEYALMRVAVGEDPHGATGMLPTLCAGVALGAISQLPVYRHNRAPFVPVDLALNVVLCQAVAQLQIYSSSSSSSSAGLAQQHLQHPQHLVFPAAADGRCDAPPHSVLVIEPQSWRDTLAWGMFGEYVLDYYGRYKEPIRRAFPIPALLPASPAMHFELSASDVVNYGVEASDTARFCSSRQVSAHRKALQSRTLSSWAVARFLAELDAAVDRTRTGRRARFSLRDPRDATGLPASLRNRIPGLSSPLQSPTPASFSSSAASSSAKLALGGMNKNSCRGGGRYGAAVPAVLTQVLVPFAEADVSTQNAYQRLLDGLAATPRAMPLLQYTALSAVDWGMYVRYTAKLVLDALAVRAVGSSSSNDSSSPSPSPSLVPPSNGFPLPTRLFVNDINFSEPLMAPPTPSVCRRALGLSDWIFRTGMNPNGSRGAMTPGLTPARMAVILAEPHIQQVMELTVVEQRTSKEEVLKRARRILARIGDTLNHVQCRIMGTMVRQLFSTVHDCIRINPGAFERLHRLNALPRTGIVYIPLHRSYSDFLILSLLLATMGLALPHIVAGEDFLRMGKFSELMRGSGAFFMRRTLRGDPLYAALFKEYVGKIVTSRMPLEFFMEGTRSRTGKTMVPKMGILKFVTDAFLAEGQNAIDDVLFVPVSLSYDELLEARMYAAELLGTPKPKESVGNMFKAAMQLKHKYGNMNIHFGEAISLKAVQANPSECPVPFQPKASLRSSAASSAIASGPLMATLPSASASAPNKAPQLSTNCTPPQLLTALAWRITYELQQNIVITAPALVAAAIETLMPECVLRGQDLPLSAVIATTARIAKAVALRGGNLLPALVGDAVRWDMIVASALVNLRRFTKVARDSPAASLSVSSSSSSPSASAPAVVCFDPPGVVSQIGVHITTNQLIHLFVDEAVVAVAVHAHGESITAGPIAVPRSSKGASAAGVAEAPVLGRAISSDVLLSSTRLLRSLLATEFPNFAAFSPCSEESWLQYALSRLALGVDQQLSAADCERHRMSRHKGNVTGGAAAFVRYSHGAIVPATPLYDFLLQLLLPHVEALYLAAVAALACLEAAEDGRPVLAPHLVTATYKAAQRLHEQRVIEYVVGCNKETITHYFQSLVDRKLILPVMAVDLGPAYVLPRDTSTPNSSSSSSSSARSAAARLQEKQARARRVAQLGQLEALVRDLQALRWHPSTDAQEDVGIAKRTVLSCLHDLSRGAKL